jgi:hypothetical protein
MSPRGRPVSQHNRERMPEERDTKKTKSNRDQKMKIGVIFIFLAGFVAARGGQENPSIAALDKARLIAGLPLVCYFVPQLSKYRNVAKGRVVRVVT